MQPSRQFRRVTHFQHWLIILNPPGNYTRHCYDEDNWDGLVVGRIKNRWKIWPKLRVAQKQQLLGGRGARHLRGARAGGRGLRAGRRGRVRGVSGHWRRRLKGGGVALGGGTGPAPRGPSRPIVPEPSGPAEPARSRLQGEGGRGAGTGQAAAGAVSLSLSFPVRPARWRARSGGGGGRAVGTGRAWKWPRGRDLAAPAPPSSSLSREGNGTGTSRHLPRPAPSATGRVLGRGWPAGMWRLRRRGLPSETERAARRERPAGEEAARPPERAEAGWAAAFPGPRHLRGGRGGLVPGPPRAVLPGPSAGRRGKVPCRRCAVTARTCLLSLLVTVLCSLWCSYCPRSGPCVSSVRGLSLTWSFLANLPVGKAGPSIPVCGGERADQSAGIKCFAEGHAI